MVLNWKWNSEKPLVFADVVLTRTLSARKAREIQAKTDRLDICERGSQAGLVGDALEEGRDREGLVKRRK